MPATTDHDCFRQPPSESIKLWRYMDFTKFVSLISTNQLFFSRADLFADPFEGAYSKANLERRPDVYKGMQNVQFENMMTQLTGFSRWIREWTYINCWHASEYESAAMWDLYAKTNESVAVETDYASLKNVLPDHAFLGLVNYIDYESDWLPEGNAFYPFTHKRKSFEHEKEVRAIIQGFPKDGGRISVGKKNEIPGIKIKVDLNDLINQIHVSPTAPNWLVDLTNEVAAKYGIKSKVRKSDLYSEPVY